MSPSRRTYTLGEGKEQNQCSRCCRESSATKELVGVRTAFEPEAEFRDWVMFPPACAGLRSGCPMRRRVMEKAAASSSPCVLNLLSAAVRCCTAPRSPLISRQRKHLPRSATLKANPRTYELQAFYPGGGASVTWSEKLTTERVPPAFWELAGSEVHTPVSEQEYK